MATDWDVFLGEHKLFGFQKRERFYREHPELVRRVPKPIEYSTIHMDEDYNKDIVLEKADMSWLEGMDEPDS